MDRDGWLEALDGFHRQAVAVVVADPDQDDCPLLLANPAFEKLTGYAQSDILGRNCRFLQCEETDSEAVAQLRYAVKARESSACMLLNQRSDGTRFHNYLCIDPITLLDGKVLLIGCQFAFTARTGENAFNDHLDVMRDALHGRAHPWRETLAMSLEARRRSVMTLARIYLRDLAV